ncbi:MAG: hypothetical protein MPW15_15040 [Candidatus Manganitrophus sp.]|nr:hypothetical protein [Candidatus Manganitrophus sp.]
MKEKKYTLSLQIAGVQGKEIDLEKIGDELRVQIGRFKRTIALPQYVAGLQPTSARLDDGTLKIVFERIEDDHPEQETSRTVGLNRRSG